MHEEVWWVEGQLREEEKKEKEEVKQLTKRQKDTLSRHSKHHTQKHMAMMRKLMRGGKTFTQAHKEAMKKVGK